MRKFLFLFFLGFPGWVSALAQQDSSMTVDCYGYPLTLSKEYRVLAEDHRAKYKKDFEAFRKHLVLHQENCTQLLNELTGVRLKFKMDDMGMYLLIKKVGVELYGDSQPPKNRVFEFHLLDLLGINTQLFYNFSCNKVYLYVKSDSTFHTHGDDWLILSCPGYRFSERKQERNADFLYQSKAGARAFIVNFNFRLPERWVSRPIEFYNAYKYYCYDVQINANAVHYLGDITFPYDEEIILKGNPMIEIRGLDSLRADVDSISNYREKINHLALFSFFSALYRNDSIMYQYDKWNFPIETLYITTGDCEDFAYLFIHLVRTILKHDACILECNVHKSLLRKNQREDHAFAGVLVNDLLQPKPREYVLTVKANKQLYQYLAVDPTHDLFDQLKIMKRGLNLISRVGIFCDVCKDSEFRLVSERINTYNMNQKTRRKFGVKVKRHRRK